MNLKILLEYLHTRFELPLYCDDIYCYLKSVRRKKKKKTKMLGKNEVRYLCADVPCRETAIYCV